MADRKTGKRIQIYLDARHAEWWATLPRWERSKIVAQALDSYRAQRNTDQNERTRNDNSNDVADSAS